MPPRCTAPPASAGSAGVPCSGRQRLFLVANQSRFLLLSEAGSSPHLASRVLGLSLRQLPREWQRLHGSALLLAESFVDPARFAGTCYRAANWLEVGRHARLRARARRRDRLSAPRRAQARVRLPAAGATRGSNSRPRGRSPPGGPHQPPYHAQRCSMALPAQLPRPSPRTRAAAAACAIRCAPRWRSCLDRAWPVVRH